MEAFKIILQLCLFLPFILLLVYFTLKLSGQTLKSVQNGRFIKLHEKVMLSKDNSLYVVQIGEKGYVVSSVNGRVEILRELTDEELSKAIENQQFLKHQEKIKSLQELVKNFNSRRKDF